MLKEFPHDETFQSTYPAGSILSTEVLEGVTEVALTGVSKGKGYQGAIRRFGLKGGPKTHGSKFHRHIG